jgi:uncharacterized protein YbcI
MDTFPPTIASQIAEVARDFQRQRTGHAPQSVAVTFGDDTLVITLHGALSPAEQVMAQTAAGAALVQEYHRQLFAGSSEALRQEIKRITGQEVREAAAEVEPATGVVVHAFTTGTMVQVFHLAQRLLKAAPPSSSPGAAAAPTHGNHEPRRSAGSASHTAEKDTTTLQGILQ